MVCRQELKSAGPGRSRDLEGSEMSKIRRPCKPSNRRRLAARCRPIRQVVGKLKGIVVGLQSLDDMKKRLGKESRQERFSGPVGRKGQALLGRCEFGWSSRSLAAHRNDTNRYQASMLRSAHAGRRAVRRHSTSAAGRQTLRGCRWREAIPPANDSWRSK